jgi:16S rRNA (uracil1498-N3)-methyltransferase
VASILRLSHLPILEQEIDLGSASREVLRSWRARPGDILTAVDPERGCYRIRLTNTGEQPRCIPFARLSRHVESRVKIEVYQALPDKERFELVLQKLTELGVQCIVPMETARSTTLSSRDAGQAKSHRWPEVILRAARQCRRAMIPELFPVMTFADALVLAAEAELRLMLYEGEEVWLLGEALGNLRPQRVVLLVGPEGGFTNAEVILACEAGFLPVGLGPRILRTETAALVGTALLQGLLGDLCRG